MPLGLWKSKWERLRQEQLRRDEEWWDRVHRRDEEWREDMAARDEEWREEMRAEREQREAEHQKWLATTEARDREWSEWRDASEERHRELIAKLDESSRNVETALAVMNREIVGMRGELRDVGDSVRSQTEGIFSLIDRFDEFEGRRPPGKPPPLRPV